MLTFQLAHSADFAFLFCGESPLNLGQLPTKFLFFCLWTVTQKGPIRPLVASSAHARSPVRADAKARDRQLPL